MSTDAHTPYNLCLFYSCLMSLSSAEHKTLESIPAPVMQRKLVC